MESRGKLWYNGVNYNYRGEKMDLGEKLLKARQEAGLSQRQLCGEVITRNMLSQIEHGTARPSMETLRYLAARLEKPISYFLEEDMDAAPLETLRQLKKAEEALAQGKHRYARQLLEAVETDVPELNRKKQLLTGRLPGADLEAVCRELPSLDEELFLRAGAAFGKGDFQRCRHLLECMEEKTGENWNLLMGKVCLAQNNPRTAAVYLLRAGEHKEVYGLLERCYRELEDYKQAYFYAVKQK